MIFRRLRKRYQNRSSAYSLYFSKRHCACTGNNNIRRTHTGIHIVDIFLEEHSVCKGYTLAFHETVKHISAVTAVTVNMVYSANLILPLKKLNNRFGYFICPKRTAERQNSKSVRKPQLLSCRPSFFDWYIVSERITCNYGIFLYRKMRYCRLVNHKNPVHIF